MSFERLVAHSYTGPETAIWEAGRIARHPFEPHRAWPSANLSLAVQHLHLVGAVARSLDALGVADFFQAGDLGGG